MRIVAIIDPGHMFDADETLGYLSIPEGMDLRAEQTKWNSDQFPNFLDYLLSQPGVDRANVETYDIYYPYG